MKHKLWAIIPAILMTCFLLTSCEAIGSIFKAGVWTGTIGVIIILVIIIYIIAKVFRRKSG